MTEEEQLCFYITIVAFLLNKFSDGSISIPIDEFNKIGLSQNQWAIKHRGYEGNLEIIACQVNEGH